MASSMKKWRNKILPRNRKDSTISVSSSDIRPASFTAEDEEGIWEDKEEGWRRHGRIFLSSSSSLSPSPEPEEFGTSTVETSVNLAVYLPQEHEDHAKLERPSRPIIEVIVGLQGTLFRIDEQAACEASHYFRKLCQRSQSLAATNLHGPKVTHVALLPNQDPSLFDMFAQWLALRPPSEPFSYGKVPTEPWFTGAVDACHLGHRLIAPDFECFALAQLIQSIAYMPFGPWQALKRVSVTFASEPLKRFVGLWVAWNCAFLGTVSKDSEYSELTAAAAAFASHVDKRRTPDPRLMDLAHWFEPCGAQLNPDCEHNPILREIRMMDERAAIARKAQEEKAANRRYSSDSYMQEWNAQTGNAGDSD